MMVKLGNRNLFRSVGPALITASVVLGPGSILTSSKVGADAGFSRVWVLIAASLMMWGMTALSARLGVLLASTPCEELSRRAGRPMAVLAGVSIFVVVAAFQFSNNLGVLAALEPFFGTEAETGAWPAIVVVTVNLVAVAALFGFRHLYVPLERLMALLVGAMIVGFVANFVFAILQPRPPNVAVETRFDLLAVLGLFGTTFSVGGAFYQAYLVRKKGWTRENLSQGLVDSAVGIGVLCMISLTIMATAALVLYGRVSSASLTSAADVALQLEPLFGTKAKALFCVGLFAGAFSSFLVNAMIGGSILADGLGLGGDMDGRWPRIFTLAALMAGMGVALWVLKSGAAPVPLIVFAQATTVLLNPILAGSLLWLASRRDVRRLGMPGWLLGLGGVALFATLVLSGRMFLVLTKLTESQ